jgi:signal transduction histidine kinase
MLDAWHQKTVDWSYMLDVQEKKEWDKFMFSKTDFVLLPENLKEVMAAVEKLYIKASFNEFGCIMLSSLEPFNNEQMAILPRFSKVFELTYTRFNDLKIAEAQAEQAKLDLIQIQTEKKKAEDTLVELRATQAQLIQSEKLASLGELTAGIAHEIQNPLNFVNNFSELSVELLEEMETEFKAGKSHDAFEIAADLKQNLSKINHHGQRASAIVKGMLEHSRTNTGTKTPTDINALADEYLRLAYHGLRAKDSNFNAVMETHFDPDLPKIEVIPQDIGRVLLNLINNAFYTVNEKAKQGIEGYAPTVTLSTKKLENEIEISVRDNGNGIPESIKDKIFQPFFTTKPTGQGTGLGLSLAYDIVTKGHGGAIELAGLVAEGTTVIVKLPVKTI